jgi:hypothetical protein
MVRILIGPEGTWCYGNADTSSAIGEKKGLDGLCC